MHLKVFKNLRQGYLETWVTFNKVILKKKKTLAVILKSENYENLTWRQRPR